MVYETYYGLSQAPFGLTPDVRFCFQHRSYLRAKTYMDYAVMREEGFLVVTGRPGMGKTTLIQDLLSDLGTERRLVARIDSTQLDADDLLRLVGYAFGLPARGWDKATLLQGLEALLRRTPRDAGTAILIVDEAQNLPDRSLEELRLITNLQEGPRALIQIFLVGQESLRDVIRQHNLEQLQQRIVAACHLEPLDASETRAYIRHRLLRAGWTGDPSFEAEALRLIHRATGGVPRLINKICDRLLLYGSVDELHRLRGEDARLVVGEFQAELLGEAVAGLSDFIAGGLEGSEAPAMEDLWWGPEEQGEPRAARPHEGASPAEGRSTQPTEPARPFVDPPPGSLEPPSGLATQGLGIPVAQGGSLSEARARGPQTPAAQPATPLLFEAEAPSPPPLSADPAREAGVSRNDYPRPEGDPQPPSGGGRAQGRPRARSRRLSLAAAAVLLLGLGSLALALQIRYPVAIASQIDRLTDGARVRLSSLLVAVDRRLGQPPDGEAALPATAPTGEAENDQSAPQGQRETRRVPDPDQANPAPPEPLEVGLLQRAAPDAIREDPAIPDGPLQGEDALAPSVIPGSSSASTQQKPGAATRPQSLPSSRLELIGPTSAPAADGDRRLAPEPDAERFEDPQGDQRDLPEHPQGPSLLTLRSPAETKGQETLDPKEPTLEGNGAGQGPSHTRGPACASDAASLRALEAELRGLGLRVQDQCEGRLTLDLAEEVPFAFGSARLPGVAGPVLDALAEALRRRPDVLVTLIGHTDDAGPANYNRRLSLARARAVEGYLQRQGVPPSRTASKGMGKDSPRADADDANAARNRRVEVIIQPAPE